MKLQRFNEHTGDRAADYYQPLMSQTYYDIEDQLYATGGFVPFTSTERAIILRYFSDNHYWWDRREEDFLIIRSSATGDIVRISRDAEEYYYIRSSFVHIGECYKCDQWAGLLQWLEDYEPYF